MGRLQRENHFPSKRRLLFRRMVCKDDRHALVGYPDRSLLSSTGIPVNRRTVYCRLFHMYPVVRVPSAPHGHHQYRNTGNVRPYSSQQLRRTAFFTRRSAQ